MVTSMPAPTDLRLDVRPLSGWTGAEIHGIDICPAARRRDEVAAIRQALLRWKVVFFRDQALDHAAQIRFGRAFGDVTPGHPVRGRRRPAEHPEIHTVSPKAYDARYGRNYRPARASTGRAGTPT